MDNDSWLLFMSALHLLVPMCVSCLALAFIFGVKRG